MSLVDPNIVTTNGGNQLMVNCWFGTRWFGFLGFHKGKGLLLRGTPRKKTAINHRLRPESGKKKRALGGKEALQIKSSLALQSKIHPFSKKETPKRFILGT